MPTYEYESVDPNRTCPLCANGFNRVEPMSADRLTRCPECGSPVRHVFHAPGIGPSETGFDRRAQDAGFHKLKKVSKGEYEKQY